MGHRLRARRQAPGQAHTSALPGTAQFLHTATEHAGTLRQEGRSTPVRPAEQLVYEKIHRSYNAGTHQTVEAEEVLLASSPQGPAKTEFLPRRFNVSVVQH